MQLLFAIILEVISGLDPSLAVTTEPRYFRLDTVASLCPFALLSSVTPLVLFVSQELGLLSTDFQSEGNRSFIEVVPKFG